MFQAPHAFGHTEAVRLPAGPHLLAARKGGVVGRRDAAARRERGGGCREVLAEQPLPRRARRLQLPAQLEGPLRALRKGVGGWGGKSNNSIGRLIRRIFDAGSRPGERARSLTSRARTNSTIV